MPLEQAWLKGARVGDVVARVKAIRTAILPALVAGELASQIELVKVIGQLKIRVIEELDRD